MLAQLHRYKNGEIYFEKQTIKKNSTKGSLAVSAGLKEFIASLLGLKVDAKVDISKSSDLQTSLKSRVYNYTWVADFLENNMDTKIESIESSIERGQFSSITRFSEHVVLKREKSLIDDEYMISINIKRDEVKLSGATSPENWLSKSLLNNLLWSSKKSEAGVHLSGLFLPLKNGASNEHNETIVHYLALYTDVNYQ